jgi:uncharacterized membrane protein
LGVALLVVVVSMVTLAPRPQAVSAAVDPAAARQIIELRCANCHAEKPTFQGFAEAPKGIKLDSDERIRAQASLIRQTVRARTMPPGNLTGLTEEERALLERWNP